MAMNKQQLKELGRKVAVAQGNAFIKELLRDSGARIGATKEDFANNLDSAIEEDIITQDKLEAWLAQVEGWGDQHLYLFQVPDIEAVALASGIAASPYAGVLGAGASLDFPKGLELKHIGLGQAGLSMEWHQSREGWNRWTPKDYIVAEGLQRFRFEAYRQRFDRSVVRFEWHFAENYCAILIHRNPDIDHAAVLKEVDAVLWAIGCPVVPLVRISLSQAVKVAARDDKGCIRHATNSTVVMWRWRRPLPKAALNPLPPFAAFSTQWTPVSSIEPKVCFILSQRNTVQVVESSCRSMAVKAD